MTDEAQTTRVLLVERDEGYGELVRRALDDAPLIEFDVREIGDVAGIADALAAAEADLLVLDLEVGSDEGLDVFRAARRASRGLPIIVLARRGDDETAIACVREGAQDYVMKDRLDADLLSRAARHAIERQKLLAKLGQLVDKLKELATADDLTGLLNRRGFTQLAEHHLRLADRTRETVVLLFIDVDGLKSVNDSHGHAEGSRLLLETADVIREATREADVVARIGGDEFCVLLTGDANGEETLVLSRIVERLATRNATALRPYKLSLSIGAARYEPERGMTLSDLMSEADRRMYEQKRAKRDRASP